MTLKVQSGVPPSVPGGMAVGATSYGVPPEVSASNGSGAAQAGVLPRVPGGITVGAAGVLPASLPVMALKRHGLVYLQCPWRHDYWSTSCRSHKPV
jgi:hypothetical protein